MISSTQHAVERTNLLLVGRVKRKSGRAAPARDIYVSPLFRYRRKYAERRAVPWFILSAKHGLLSPDTHIEPYDLTLADFPPAKRRVWSQRVLDQLKDVTEVAAGDIIEIHTGKLYVEYGLERGLRQAGAEVRRPLAHMPGIGSQIAWYKGYLESGRPREGKQ